MAERSEVEVLLIDDSEVALDFLEQLLNNLGFEKFQKALDADEALDVIARYKADNKIFPLIITDHRMPEVTGVELIEKLRADKFNKDSVIFVITAEADIGLVMNALNAGANDFLVKPVEVDDLEKKISKFFQ